MRVAIFGGSGFVGARLFERWMGSDRFEPVPIVHSTGNAWRIVRTGQSVRMCDLLVRASVREALDGCDVVVNATRGSEEVMLGGLRNLLEEAAAARVSRFVHLSSVLVFGDPPPPDSVDESCAATPVEGTYGAIKALQDGLVSRAAAGGLSSAILCPPNIGGAGSHFLLGVARSIADGSFALLDGEPGACALVDVDNLCDAIELALTAERTPLNRLLVVDQDMLPWPAVVRLIADRLGLAMPKSLVSRCAVAQEWRERNVPPARPSLRTALRHIGSSRVRSLLREDPLLGRIESTGKRLIRKMRPSAEETLLQATDGPAGAVAHDPWARLARPYLYQQLRSVYHSSQAAQVALNYAPKMTSTDSISRFCGWFLEMSGWAERDFGDLARFASETVIRGPLAASGGCLATHEEPNVKSQRNWRAG